MLWLILNMLFIYGAAIFIARRYQVLLPSLQSSQIFVIWYILIHTVTGCLIVSGANILMWELSLLALMLLVMLLVKAMLLYTFSKEKQRRVMLVFCSVEFLSMLAAFTGALNVGYLRAVHETKQHLWAMGQVLVLEAVLTLLFLWMFLQLFYAGWIMLVLKQTISVRMIWQIVLVIQGYSLAMLWYPLLHHEYLYGLLFVSIYVIMCVAVDISLQLGMRRILDRQARQRAAVLSMERIQLMSQQMRQSILRAYALRLQQERYIKSLSDLRGQIAIGMHQDNEKIDLAVSSVGPYCDHPLVNAVLVEKQLEAKILGFRVKWDVTLKRKTVIDHGDLCIIFAQLLQTAIKELSTNHPINSYRKDIGWIRLRCKERSGYLVIACTSNGTKLLENSKDDLLRIMASKYEGKLRITRHINQREGSGWIRRTLFVSLESYNVHRVRVQAAKAGRSEVK